MADLYNNDSEGLFNSIKDFIYNHPGFPIVDIYRLFGILLRDHVFQKYPEIITGQVNTSNP
jgi:hypothetical protein